MVALTAGEVYSTKETYGCKGSRLSHIGPGTGNKEIQPIRGSKRTVGSGSGTLQLALVAPLACKLCVSFSAVAGLWGVTLNKYLEAALYNFLE